MIYLDNHATTPPDPLVLEAMRPALEGEGFGNPSSTHGVGVAARRLLESARAEVARICPAPDTRVVFTSGATEANALAVLGRAPRGTLDRIVVSAIEHPSVMDCARELMARGCSLEIVSPDSQGIVSADDVLDAVEGRTALVAVMLVNNEVGTVQPSIEIARRVRRKFPQCHVHVDATQAVGMVDITGLEDAHSVALSAHKIYGPKGVGALVYREKSAPRPLWFGGGQEGGIRSGTQNVAGAVGLGRAVSIALTGWAETAARMAALRDELVREILGAVAGTSLVGHPERRSPANALIGVEGVTGDAIAGSLEARGVVVSTGSACHAGRAQQSGVLAAMKVPGSMGVVRFGLSRNTTRGDIATAATAFVESVAALRS
jgi:cysteine desulfurase